MLILKLALRNLSRHLRKSLIIGSLIAIGVAALFTANAIFESSNRGLRSSFVRSVTGDLVVSERGETAYGLFGSEVPIVSDYESIPAIAGFSAMTERFDKLDGLEAWTPLVSAAAKMSIGGVSFNVPVFGVDPSTYFTVCSDIVIQRGDTTKLSAGGVFLNMSLLAAIEMKLGRMLEMGETVTFSMYSNGSFKIRTGILAGVHSYPGSTEVLDRLVLADPTIVRSLADYTLGYTSSSTLVMKTGSGDDLDDLFANATDVIESDGASLTLDNLEEELADTSERDLMIQPDAAAWSFALFRAMDGQTLKLDKSLRDEAMANGWNIRVLDWRGAAGASAQALFAVQGAFYAGMGFIVIGAILVIMNALVISVLERTSEIGTMRGLGAGTGFIRSLFIAESMSLTLVSTAMGIILGIAVSSGAAHFGIRISNPLLVSLFGGNFIRPVITLRSVLLHLGMATIVGSIAWIYPVSLAMRIQPVSAMNVS
jgi:putative ABC transport system permease protein